MSRTSGPLTMATLPSHVSPDRVRPFPFHEGQSTTEHPFHGLIPKLLDGPDVFYTLDGYHHMGPLWVFRRYRDVATLFSDTEHFSCKDNAPFSELEGGNWHLVPSESDPPAHAFHRAMVNPLFTPKRMAEMEHSVREVAIDAIETFKDRGECDFMADMALKFPIAVFLNLMNLPMSQVDQFLEWETGLVRASTLEESRTATVEVIGFLREVIEARRKNPGNDLISYGLTTQLHGRRFDEDELLGFCFNLFIGGLDTVTTNMGWQARHLGEHLDHQATLRANPTQIPAAVEELLRRYAAVTPNRRCIKEVTVGDVRLMPGDIIALPTPLANNDASVFESPLEVRLDRNPRHLAFATGIHRCVGAPLARRELIIALQEMLSRLPEFRIKPGVEIVSHIGPIIQVDSLPLVWDVRVS